MKQSLNLLAAEIRAQAECAPPEVAYRLEMIAARLSRIANDVQRRAA